MADRPSVITLRCTREEHLALTRQATAAGLSLNEYLLRQLLPARPPRPSRLEVAMQEAS